MSYLDFPFIYEKKKKETELIPLYEELSLPEKLPKKEDDKEEKKIIIIQL